MTQKEIQNVLFEAFQERKRVEIEYKEHDGTTSQAVTPVDAILFYDRGLPSCFRSGTHTIFLKHIISVRIPPEEVLVNVGDYVQFTHRCKDWIVKTVAAGEAAWLIDINTGFTWAGPITSRELGTTEFDILPYLSEGETNVRIIKVEHKVLPLPPEEVLVRIGDCIRFTYCGQERTVKVVRAGGSDYLIDLDTGFAWMDPMRAGSQAHRKFNILPYLSDGETNVRLIDKEL